MLYGTTQHNSGLTRSVANGVFVNVTGDTMTGALVIACSTVTTGTQTSLTITGAANTGLTASTEVPDVNLNLARTVQWATGALTTQRFVRIQTPTLGFVGSSTVTNAVTMQIDGAPVAGTNATLSSAIAFKVLAGTASANGIIVQGASSQSGDLLALQDSTPAKLASFDSKGNLGLNPVAQSSGTQASILNVSNPAHTGLTASTEFVVAIIDLNRTVQLATGALALQRFVRVRQPTIGFVGTSTVTAATTMQIDGAPVAGTNAVLTETSSLRVLAGSAGAKAIVAQGASSQTANILEVQNSTPATVALFDSKGNLAIQPVAQSSGTQAAMLLLTGIGHTGMTASTEYNDANFALARSVQFATGNITTQRTIRIQAPTLRFAGTSTITTAATVQIDSAPTVGTNAVITENSALRVLAGAAASKAIIAQAAASPTANILEVQNSSSTSIASFDSKGDLNISPVAQSSGTQPAILTVTGSAHTGLTASTELVDVNLNLARTVQLATGNVTTQRFVRVQTPTLGFVGTSTVTTAATMQIDGAPVVGTNAVITESCALRVVAGTRKGLVVVGSGNTYAGFDFKSSGGVSKIQMYDNGYYGYGIITNPGAGAGANNEVFGNSTPQGVTGTNNTALGYSAAAALVGGNYNTAIGSNALSIGSAPSFSTALGYNCIANYNSTRGTGFGYRAGVNATGLGATFIGADCGANCTTSVSCLSVGAGAVGSGTATCTANYFTILGYQAGYSLTSGHSACFVGNSSGYYCSSGTNNAFFGSNSGQNITTGSFNTMIGNDAGYATDGTQNTTQDRAILLGYAANGNTFADVTVLGVNGIAYATKQCVMHFGNATGDAPTLVFSGKTNTTRRQVATITSAFNGTTDGSYIGKLTFSTFYANTAQEILRFESASDQSRLGIGGAIVSGTRAIVYAGVAAEKVLVVQGAGSQSGNLQEWQSSAPAILSFVDANGNFGIGRTTTSAVLHLKAGTATASTAPLKFTSGTNLSVVEDGAMEYNGTHLYFSIGSTRYQIDQPSASLSIGSPITSGTAGSILYIDVSGQLAQDNTNFYWDYTNKKQGIGINSSLPGQLSVVSTSAANKVIVARGTTSQSGNLIEAQTTTPTTVFTVDCNGATTHSPIAVSSGTQTALLITGAANTGMTASTEVSDVNLNLARTVQWATGNITTQRSVLVQTPTLGFVGTSTVATAATMQIDGAPVAGTNAVLTETSSLRVLAGSAAAKAIIAQGAASQTANILEIQNSTPATIALFDSRGNLVVQPVAQSSGTQSAIFTVTGPAHTGLTASTELVDINLNLARTVQLATGALTTQRFIRVQTPTLGFVGTSTVTTAVTMQIDGAPVVGTNAVITNQFALRVLAGAAAAKAIVAQGAASQTANIFEIQNSTPATVALFDKVGNLTLQPVVQTSGTQAEILLVTGPAHTGLTASTEYNDVNLNLARTVQLATGALTTQRFVRVQQPTIGFVGASTVTTAATMQIDGAPAVGTNATITESSALRVLSGAAAAKALVIRGFAAQSANLFEVQNSSGTLVAKITATNLSVPGIGSGSRNELFGAGASSVATGADNTTLGSTAGTSLAAGTNNVIIGSTAGDALTDGTDNVLIGYDAGGAMVGSNRQYNIAIGTSALRTFNQDSSTAPQVAIGYQALYACNQANAGNVGIGWQAGFSWSTNQYNNVAVGMRAGYGNTGIAGVFVGAGAGLNATGGGNIAIGWQALAGGSGAGSTAVGYLALFSMNSTNINTAVGYQAGRYVTTGSRNTYLGYLAAAGSASNTTMSRQIAIGDSVLTGNLDDVTIIGVNGTAYATKQVVLHIGQSAGDAPTLVLSGKSSTSVRPVINFASSFISNTDASYTTQLLVNAYYANTAQEIIRVNSASDQSRLGFGGAIVSGVRATLYSGVAADKGLVIRGTTSQSGNLFETQDVTPTTTSLIDAKGNYTIQPVAQSSGTQSAIFTVTGPAHTGLTASTELVDVNLNLARTVQLATGALTTQRFIRVQTPTLGFVGTSTVTTAVTMQIDGAPVVGTNAVITNQFALRVLAGAATAKAIIAQGAASQTANIFEIQNSTPATVALFDKVGGLTLQPVVQTSGTQAAIFTVTGPAHTGLTASTEYNDVNLNLARTVQLATGNVTTQRFIRVQTPTLGFVGTSTVITAATMQIDGAPVVGTNAVLTETSALRVLAGAAAAKGLIVQAAGSPTANILEIQNSSSTALSTIDKDGYGFLVPVTFGLAIGTAATTGTSKTIVAIMPRAGKIVKAFIRAKTGPTGQAFICDINLNGTSIWASTQANRIQIAAAGTNATQTSFDTTTFAEGDYFEIDIDQVGSGTAGQDVTVVLLCSCKNQ